MPCGVYKRTKQHWAKGLKGDERCERQPRLFLNGMKFGRLVVIERANDPLNRGTTKTFWLCKCDCGKEKIIGGVPLQRGSTRSCGCLRAESSARTYAEGRNRQWKGGRHTHISGYVKIWKPRHPNAQKGGYILEHIYVMSELLGRPLLKNETVHHKNGIKTDNRPENLELWTSSHSSGQRIEDKIAWCLEFLSIYAPEKLQVDA